ATSGDTALLIAFGAGLAYAAQVVTLPRAPAVDNLAVVVADDIASNRLVLVEMLRTLGYEPIEAESGAEAVEALKSSGARLAFLDRHMPGTDGLWALRRIADDPGLGAVRSIVISASANARSEERLRAARALAVLEKPLTLRMVGEAARDALED
ncbi:MAG: response regulator, partial [Rubricella sp.]